MSKPLIYIVDDNDGFRQSVAFMLDSSYYRIEQFDSAEAAIERLEHCEASDEACMLLDVRMPGLSGLDLHDRVNRSHPGLPIIYMTGHADVSLAVEAMKKGAVTLLEKPLDPEALKSAVDTAMEKARQIQAKSASDSTHNRLQTDDESVMSEVAVRDFDERLQTLTPREMDVLEKLVHGKANKECAFELSISVRTVEMHRARILKKLEVRSGVDLIRAVLLRRAQQ